MDLQVRKIHFVQEFLRLNNDGIVGKLENLLKHEKSKLYAENPEPYTLAQLNEIIDCAEEDAKNNRMKSVDELQKEIKILKAEPEKDENDKVTKTQIK